MATEERCHILGIIPVVSNEERNDLLCSIMHTHFDILIRALIQAHLCIANVADCLGPASR